MIRRAATLALILAATPALAVGDPLEPVNRHVHAFNLLAQRHLLGPMARAYAGWTPAPVREGVANALANLGEPVTAASALLAGDVTLAAQAAARFGINTTLGYGGMRDTAAEMGYPPVRIGVADALCRWGVPSGPYLVLPLLGPSTLRDAGGMIATSLALSHAIGGDTVLAWSAATSWTEYAALHPALMRIETQALDLYATHRSLYRQRRAASCGNDPMEDTPQ